MGRFACKLLLFMLPFLLILAAPAAVLLASGELTSVERIIALQSNAQGPILFGRAYSDPTPRYKLQSVLQRNPQVLVLGTSRVLAIRSTFFRKGVAFFNAGNGITRLGHLRLFLQRLPPESTPQVIVLGVDQYFLNGNFDGLVADDMESLWSSDRSADDIMISSWLDIYRDYAQGKFSLNQLIAPTSEYRIGVNARVHVNAFRNDGSYHWGQYVSDPTNPNNPDHNFQNTLDRIARGDRRFQYAEHVSEANLVELDLFLAECKKRGIYVTAFLPPFAHAVYERMRSMSREYGYLRELPSRLRPVFAKYGYRISDFSDLATLGAPDVETIDGFHGSEKAYARLFVHLIEADPVLARLGRDPRFLRARIEQSQGHHQVFRLGEL